MRRLILSLAVLLTAAVGGAAPLAREEVPPPLTPWVAWALRGHEAQLCSFYHGQERRFCAWPGTLSLSLDENGGRFEQAWTAQADGWVPLPGGPERWPQDVKVDGAPAVVVRRGDAPSVRLKAGAHALSGAFKWERLPEQLELPAETGLLALSVRGAAIAFPPRDENGRLWLQPRAKPAAEKEESHLEVSVHRRLVDEIPLQLLTKVQLKVSGGSRETVLGKALPDGFVPMSLVSPLPARLDADGRLRVQARAGTWDIMLVSRRDGRKDSIAVPAQAEGAWDQDEAWVFESRPNLRLSELEGAPSLDPQQTELPEDWKSYPAFLVRPGAALKLAERQRGDEPPAPDRLNLSRELWLDFDGKGFSARDRISGSLGRSWRLESSPEMKLGRVAIDGFDQFLTSLSSGGAAGLELRAKEVSLTADSRIEGRGLPASGWSHDFESVAASLHLPPGWRLLHAGGVDQAGPTWITSWSLLDLFLVLISAAAFGRLWGPRWGAAALIGIGLAWHEPGAPRWLWLWVLVAAALSRALAENELWGKLSSFLRRGLWLGLVLVAIPFLVKQARVALYPDLELPHHSVQPRQPGQIDAERPASAPQVEFDEGESLEQHKGFSGGRALEAMRGGGLAGAMASADQSYLYPGKKAARQKVEMLNQLRLDPKAQVTTGPGLPYWTWRTVRLSWKGPVPAGHRVKLWLIPPAGSLALSLARIALVSLLVLLLAGLPVGDWLDSLRGPEGRSKILRAILPALALALWPLSASAQSGYPPQNLIDELRARLLERPDCALHCAESPRLRLEATSGFLSLKLEVHAAAPTAVPVPSGGREWTPSRATLDGSPARIRRAEDGSLWVPVTAGSHQLTLDGPLPERDAVQLALPLKPRRVDSSITGWSLHGVRDDGRPEDALQLSRSRGTPSAETAAARAQGIYPPLLKVERILRLGLSWTVETKVTRLTPGGSPISAQIPLLPGESITSPEPRVAQGKAQLSLAPQAYSASWFSVLKEDGTIALLAPETSLWTESWRVEPGPTWHVETAGLPRVLEEGGGARAHLFRPWPGESVRLAITRPAAVSGQTLTIDQSVLTLTPGVRATDAELTLSLRSSRGGQHTLTLPEGASLLSAKIDGAVQPLRLEGRKLTLPIRPGPHAVVVAWRQPGGARTLFKAPALSLGASSVNAHVQLALPSRWILFVGGPGIGPAVVFWSLLTIFLLVAVALGKTGLSPLSWRSWFLLSLGLTQISVTAAALVAGWFLVMGLRAKHPPQQSREFKLAQLFLVGLTIAAGVCLFRSITRGLLGLPDMQISGNGSSAQLLRWYLDRGADALPRPWAFSTPLWVYRLAMLAWALWLAESMLRWSRWAWGCFTTEGAWK